MNKYYTGEYIVVVINDDVDDNDSDDVDDSESDDIASLLSSLLSTLSPLSSKLPLSSPS